MRNIFVQFIKFGAVGFSSTFVSYCVYALLVYKECPYLLGNVIGFIAGTINSFVWNSLFVFRKAEHEQRNPLLVFVKTFIVYGLSSLLLSSLLLALFVGKLGVSKYVAPVMVLSITVPMNFVMNKLWAYK